MNHVHLQHAERLGIAGGCTGDRRHCRSGDAADGTADDPRASGWDPEAAEAFDLDVDDPDSLEFTLTRAGAKDWILKAESQKEFIRWVDAIQLQQHQQSRAPQKSPKVSAFARASFYLTA